MSRSIRQSCCLDVVKPVCLSVHTNLVIPVAVKDVSLVVLTLEGFVGFNLLYAWSTGDDLVGVLFNPGYVSYFTSEGLECQHPIIIS